ncbi:hypothetical protein BU14_0260s0021 [Porphyra umbilicalis]|uniref:Uncharacterized protein n=1 Tax=Porphyra umbilicalis TaxID=2786 RepID=A0A1X6P243_PORUM|nr:hypothetical protein BU14_0260s0021 [Porphyra umbilicalis]|eukprot:OSX74952.1 hypothetical protein BU14_0260s0021 [Porphyra umbilicalis]
MRSVRSWTDDKIRARYRGSPEVASVGAPQHDRGDPTLRPQRPHRWLASSPQPPRCASVATWSKSTPCGPPLQSRSSLRRRRPQPPGRKRQQAGATGAHSPFPTRTCASSGRAATPSRAPTPPPPPHLRRARSGAPTRPRRLAPWQPRRGRPATICAR